MNQELNRVFTGKFTPDIEEFDCWEDADDYLLEKLAVKIKRINQFSSSNPLSARAEGVYVFANDIKLLHATRAQLHEMVKEGLPMVVKQISTGDGVVANITINVLGGRTTIQISKNNPLS